MKIAICLAVKNESAEMPYWIAWHALLGIDTFFIYNDQSTDSTLAVLKSLQEKYDIRIKNVCENKDDHVVRQVQIYNSCLNENKDQFDWIGFIDADEYVYINHGDIKEFLAAMAYNINCVALNWCCFGSNHHLARPESAPFLAYQKHGDRNQYWNRHTKVFVRPKEVKEEITYVHNIFVNGKTVSSDGEEIQWTNMFGGFTQNPPNWKNARLLHFQTRSFEHYIKRFKYMEPHRKENQDDPVHQVLNDNSYNLEVFHIRDDLYFKFITEMQNLVKSQMLYLKKILCTIPYDIFPQIENQLKYTNHAQYFNPPKNYKSHQVETRCISVHRERGIKISHARDYYVFKIKDHNKNTLKINNRKIVHASPNEDSEIFCFYIAKSKKIHFFSSNLETFLLLFDPRYSHLLTYDVWQNPNGSVSFSHPRTKNYMCSNMEGEITVNRKRAWEWEWFDLEVVDINCAQYYEDFSLINTISSIYNKIYFSFEKNIPLHNYISMLPDDQRIALDFLSGGFFGEHIY